MKNILVLAVFIILAGCASVPHSEKNINYDSPRGGMPPRLYEIAKTDAVEQGIDYAPNPSQGYIDFEEPESEENE